MPASSKKIAIQGVKTTCDLCQREVFFYRVHETPEAELVTVCAGFPGDPAEASCHATSPYRCTCGRCERCQEANDGHQ